MKKLNSWKTSFWPGFRLKCSINGLSNSKIVCHNSPVNDTLHHTIFQQDDNFSRHESLLFMQASKINQNWKFFRLKFFISIIKFIAIQNLSFFELQMYPAPFQANVFSSFISQFILKINLPLPQNGQFWGVEFFWLICQTVF